MGKPNEGRSRVVIENVEPQLNCGRFPIKRIVDDLVSVEADVFGDGHDEVRRGSSGSRKGTRFGRQRKCVLWETTAGRESFRSSKSAATVTRSWVKSTTSGLGAVT